MEGRKVKLLINFILCYEYILKISKVITEKNGIKLVSLKPVKRKKKLESIQIKERKEGKRT